jgi:hypothetical protein
MSPSTLSPTSDLEDNPFEAEFNGDDDDNDIDDGLDFSTPPIDDEISNFAVLNSSLPLPHQLPRTTPPCLVCQRQTHMAYRERKETASDEVALWHSESVAADGGHAGDIPHAQDDWDGVEGEAESWGFGWYSATAAIEHERRQDRACQGTGRE